MSRPRPSRIPRLSSDVEDQIRAKPSRLGALRFKPSVERRFHEYAFEQNKKWFMTGTLVVAVIFLLFFSVMYLLAPDGMPPFVDTVPYISAGLFLLGVGRKVGERTKVAQKQLIGWIVASFCVLVGLSFSQLSATASVDRARYGFGLVIVFTIAIYALVQLRGVQALVAGWGTSVCHAWLAYSAGYYERDNFLQVCSYLVLTNLMGTAIAYTIERQNRLFFGTMLDASAAHERTKKLLRQLLPAPIADRMLKGEARVADQFDYVTVMFAHVHGIRVLAETKNPKALVALLNRIFGAFDEAAQSAGIDKVKSSGSRYLAAAGLAGRRPKRGEPSGATRVVRCALEMRRAFDRAKIESGLDVELSIGIHTGPVVAGVIGKTRLVYDMWGDTVNVASRMESVSARGETRLSTEAAAWLLDESILSEPQTVDVKGKGKVQTHVLLEGAAQAAAAQAPTVEGAA